MYEAVYTGSFIAVPFPKELPNMKFHPGESRDDVPEWAAKKLAQDPRFNVPNPPGEEDQLPLDENV